MFSKFSAIFAISFAFSPILVAAGSHNAPQRRHGHVGMSRLTANDTLSTNHTLATREDGARLTMYYQTGNAGACGIWNSDNDFIVALNWQQYESENWCFKMIEIHANGKSAKAQIVDECPGCPWGALDCTPAIANYFGFFDDETYGSWNFVDAEPTSSSKPPPPPPTTTRKTSSPPPPPPKTTSKAPPPSSSFVWSALPSSSSVWSAPASSPSSSARHASSLSSSHSASESSSGASTTGSSASPTWALVGSTPSATPISLITQMNASFLDMVLLSLAASNATK